MALSRRLRYEILRRDNHACRYCGATAPDTPLTVDHVVPQALGGTDEPTNLVTACQPCNSGKAATTPDAPLVADVAADALRWARAMAAAAALADQDRSTRAEHHRWVNRQWREWHDHRGEHFDRPLDWSLSVDQFIAAGLDIADVLEAIDDAMRRRGIDDRWAYTCGILWRTLEARQRTARAIVNAQRAADEDA